MFTWSGLAPRKLDELRTQGWRVNGYALYREGSRGLIDLHGAVHWLPTTPQPSAAEDADTAGKGVDANCWSADYGDTWLDCPDDADFVHGLKVGDEYELQASVYSWTERFRVTKVPDDANDDYEIERVSPPALTRQPVAGDGE